MTLKEQCEVDGISLAEGKVKYNLTHWKQEVVADAPESCDEIELVEEVTDVVVSAKDLLKESQDVMKLLMKDCLTAENALIGIKMIGKKSKYYPFIKVLQTLVD